MKRTVVLLALLYICFHSLSAQGLKVVDIKEIPSGSDAFHAPVDGNGHPCGLVKIQSVSPDLHFKGEIVGDVSLESNEYKVYMSKGSRQLIIKRSQVMPLVIRFPEYGIEEISSKATYLIKLKEFSLNPQKNVIAIGVKPYHANVYIDDVLIDNENKDGSYRLLLPKGEHTCRIEARGYRSYASIVKTGKGPQTVNVELESLLADIEINSQLSSAHIFVEGEDVGIGSWKGKLPAGTYQIEVRQEGFVTKAQTVVLEEKGNSSITIPSLKRAKGNLHVFSNPKEAKVFLDGDYVNNPIDIKGVYTGKHKLTVRVPFGYKVYEQDVVVKTDGNDTIQANLVPLNGQYARAFDGDLKAQVQLCKEKMLSAYRTADNDTIERNFWFEQLYKQLDRIDKESFNIVCPCTFNGSGCDMKQAGIYTYFRNTAPSKSLDILYKWYQFEPDNGSVVLEIALVCNMLNDYQSVIKWGTLGLDICDFEGDLISFVYLIAEACIKIGDVNRAVDIFKNHEDGGRGDYYIAEVYKELGDCKNALVFYKKCLQSGKYHWTEEVKEKIAECSR